MDEDETALAANIPFPQQKNPRLCRIGICMEVKEVK